MCPLLRTFSQKQCLSCFGKWFLVIVLHLSVFLIKELTWLASGMIKHCTCTPPWEACQNPSKILVSFISFVYNPSNMQLSWWPILSRRQTSDLDVFVLFWNRMKVSRPPKSSPRANSSASLSQFELFSVCFPNNCFCKWKTSNDLKGLCSGNLIKIQKHIAFNCKIRSKTKQKTLFLENIKKIWWSVIFKLLLIILC